ncbi:MAG: MFS transporter [Candidatus Nanopelagicaceae bacterium]
MGLHRFETKPLRTGASIVTLGHAWTFARFFSGILADRGDQKRIMIWADLIRAGFSLVLMVAVLEESLSLAYVAVAASGVVAVFFSSSSFALLPRLVDRSQLGRINGVHEIVGWGVTALGPVMAALTYVWRGPAWSFGIDAATFVASAVLLSFIRLADPVEISTETPRVRGKIIDHGQCSLREAREGLVYVWRHPVAKWFLITVAGPTITSNANAVALIFLLNQDLKAPLSAIGFVFSLNGIVAVIAASVVTVRAKHIEYGKLLILSVAGMVTSQFVMGFAPSLTVLALGVVIGAVANAPFNIAYDTVLQQSVDQKFLGRVEGLGTTISNILQIVVLIGAGVLVASVGARWVFILAEDLSGFCVLVGGVVRLPRMRATGIASSMRDQ